MKKKFLAISILAILVIMLIILTGCGNTLKSNENSGDLETKNKAVETNKTGAVKDIANIGEFIDYPVKYTNVSDKFNKDIVEMINSNDTGWRILSKENDTITIISTGIPLSYKQYYIKDKGTANVTNELKNLYTTLNNDSTYKEGGYSYFSKSGFTNNTFDMTKVFNTGLEDTTSIHTFDGNDLIKLYKNLTGKENTIYEMYNTPIYLNNKSLELDNNSKAKDLIANGREYYINEYYQKETNVNNLYVVSNSMIFSSRDEDLPIRIVLNLKNNLKITGGDGTLSNPYQIGE